MKHASMYKRVLSVMLVLAMLFTTVIPTVSAEQTKAASNLEELTLTPIDASTLESRKLNSNPDDSIEAEAHKLTDLVRVSIQLEKASTVEAGFALEGIADNAAAKDYRSGLRADQAAMTAKIEKAIGGKLDVKWNLTLAANIISANVLYGQIDTIKGIDGVKDVFLENRYEPQEDLKDLSQTPIREPAAAPIADEPENGSASHMIGSNLAWAAGYTGAGSKVAVIDTGIDKDHQSFSAEGLEYALKQNAEAKGMSYDAYIASLDLLTAERIDAVKDQLNANITSGAQAHLSTKIGYAYNYVDSNFDITHENDTQGEHGSHVEGISAANRFIKVGDEFKPALEAVGTQGVAPDAQIVTMKVFGSGGGAYDSDYMAAIEDAIVLGCDSANLSLGSGSTGFGFSGQYESVMNKLVASGMVCSFSAGNSGMWYDSPNNSQMPYPYLYIDDNNFATGGSPGSFTNSLTVASVDNVGQTGMPLLFGDRHVFYTETSGYGNNPMASIANNGQEYEYVFVDGPGVDDNNNVGKEGDAFFALGSEVVSGKVAICYRGSSSFFAKANAAVAQGAVAVIIVNNTTGSISMNLTDYAYHAPAVSILKADGDAIKADSEAVKDEAGNVLYYTGTMSIGSNLEVFIPEITDTVNVSSFSSFGVPGTLVMKPEILAPGGSIYSVFGYNNTASGFTGGHDQYELMSGTSMAAPQVNGMAGVMGQYIRESGLAEKTGLTARQLTNSLLMSTAHPVFDEYNEYWPIIRVGAGLANVGDAVSAKSYILMNEDSTLFPDTAKDGKVKAELGDDPDRTGSYDFSFTVYPLEESKEFTLRTDLFSQDIAGNAGYGMLQYTGSILLDELMVSGFDQALPAYDVTYEVNGETFGETFTVEADVNEDGATDALDAQAILDSLTGKLAEDATFNAEVADVDGDGEITTVDARLILESAESKNIVITEPTEVKVHIELSDYAKMLYDVYFTGGAYLQGYTFLDPVADEEGVMDVTHSIPILAYYGSWTDASMFDRDSAIDNAYGTGKLPYIGNSNTNYLTLRNADGQTSVYMGNPYMIEDKFPADRLAMSTTTTLYQANFLPIRNVGSMGAAITDADGKVLWNSSISGNRNSAYYYVNGGTWQNTSPANFSINKSLGSVGVKEDDQITVGFYALPEYYAITNAKDNGQVATSGMLDAAGFKNVIESGKVGDGAAIKYTVKVDDTAPEVTGALRDLISGDITVKCSDNNYVAYVAVMNKTGSKVFFETCPAQTKPNEALDVALTLDGVKLPNEVTLLVADYAGNESAFKVALGGSEEEDNGGLMLGFTSANGSVGSGNRALEITVDELFYQSATNFGGVSVYSNTNFKVTAAEYVDGYVFMAADDGWLYAAPLDALDEAEAVGKYSDKTATIYDLAFSYEDSKLYALGLSNTIYQVDLITGKLTPAFIVTLPGVDGVYAEATKLAIDEKGTAYIVNYGSPTNVKLFKFDLPEPIEEEEEPEEIKNVVAGFYFEGANAEEALAGWTFVDKDGDGKNWAYDTSSSPIPTKGGKIMSASYAGGVLTPDNWAITPAADLTGKVNTKVTFTAQNYSSGYPDTLAFYVGTTANPDEMTKLGADVQPAAGDWTTYTFDIPAEFADASEIYAAVRHYNCSDQFRVYFDAVEFLGDDPAPADDEPEPEPEPEAAAVTAEAIGAIGAWSYNKGGSLAYDYNEEVLYLAGNYNATTDTDHNLWKINPETGKGTKAGASGKANPGRFFVCLTGLIIIPGHNPLITPTENPTDLIVEPTELNLLKGQTSDIRINVMPWTLIDKSYTVESLDPTIATVNEKGVVTGVAVGETKIKVQTVATPVLTKEVTVKVTEAPDSELRGIIWDADGKGQAALFHSNATQDWAAQAQVGAFRFGALVDDKVYGSTDDTMYYYDADTYEVTTLGGIVSQWIPSDAIGMPEDMVVAWGLDAGFRVGGLCNNGTYFEVLDPAAGSLNYWDLSSAYSADPMAVIAIVGRGDFDVNGTAIENGLHAVMITESGHIWDFYFNMEGSLYRVDSNKSIDLSLEGVSDPTNETGASLFYDEQTEFMYLSLYNGADDNAHLYAIDFNDPARLAEVGTFNEKVWPVVGLHQYTPATDLVLKVEPDEISMFEGETAELKIKVKLGETNEYDVAIADETVASYADGIVTGLKEGETTITVTTKDTNDAGETLSKEIPVTVKGLTHLDSSVVAQVTDDNGANFVTLNLNNLSTMTKAAAPGNVTSGARTGDIYMAGVGTSISAVDAEDLTTPAAYEFDSFYAQYPAQDIANYPIFKDEEGELDEHKALFTTNLGWLVTPDYYGWNLSSYLPDMAGICFGGTDEDEDGAPIYVYYLLTTAGILYEVDVSYSSGSLAYQSMIDTGIKLENQSDASMAYIYDVKLNPDYTIAPKNVGIVIADNGTKKLWFVDFQTAEIGLIGTIDATNISGLVGTFDTLATVVTDDGDAAASELNRVGDGLAFMSKTTKENGIDTIFERAKVGETTNATVGGTNAIKVSKLGKTPVIGRDSVISGSEGDASVTLTSDEPIANGLFQIKYDTEALTFVGAESDAKIFSVNEKDGVITFAFAAIEPFAADATIATLKFTYANDYVDTTVTVTTLERNDDTAVEEEPEELALTQEDGDHNWVEDTEARVEPTCTETGLATYKCTKCGDVKVETLDALDHDWNEGEITTAATCTEDGVKTFTCARCGETRTEAISAPGHTPVDVEAVAPTCTEAGATAGKKCSVCGAILEGIEIVLPTGHTIEVIPAIPATCTEGGMTAGAKCSVCGEILVAPTATEKLGHTPEEIPAVPATCTEAGLTAGSKCAVCGEILDAPKPVEALGHAWDQGKTIAPATCTAEGVMLYTCRQCNETRTEAISAKGHTASDVAAVEPTCTASGKTAGKICSVCGAILEGIEDVPAKGHTVVIDEAVAPTLTAEGKTAGAHCSVCGEILVAQETIAKLDASELRAVLAGAEAIDPDTLTDESAAALAEAIEDAKAALTEPTTQEALDKAAEELAEVVKNLQTKPDTTELEKAITDAEAIDPETLTDESAAALAKAIEDAKKALEEAKTQKEVDDAKAALDAAIAALETKPTPAPTPTPTHVCPGAKFTDMPALDNWAHKPIDWAIVNGITAGTSDTTFGPDEGCTRAQVVTFLWRAAKQPEPKTTSNPFTDVKEGDYFYKAVLWAVENGITKGTSDTEFSPADTCTRGQIVTFLYRYEGEPKVDATESAFSDVKTTDYFFAPIAWAVENEITQGIGDGKFGPNDTCTRAQVVTFLYRDIAE